MLVPRRTKLIVILNDNDMSIAPPVGAMSAYLAKLISGGIYRGFRNFVKKTMECYRRQFVVVWFVLKSMGEVFTGGTLFEEMGFYYVGPIDGHNFNHFSTNIEK